MLQDETLRLKFDNSYNGRLFAVQGDTGRTYNLQILSDLNNVLDVSGMKLRLYIGNDKEVSYTDGEITQAEEGKFKVQVYNSQLKYSGLQKAQFVLTDKDGQKVGSKVFDLYIEEGLETGTSLGKNILVDFETIDETLRLLKNYDNTLEEAKEVDLKLKVDIQEGTETREVLSDCKKKALEIKDQLDTSKTDAGKTLQDLKTTKTESESLKTGLESENIKTGKNIQTLTEKTETGNKTIAGLGQSIEKAVQTDATLKSTDTKAQGTKTEIEKLLGESKNTEQALKEIIASGDLDKYITDPKLQEALKAYATKEDLKGIDVTEQLKDYAKTVDVTSALEKKVDVKAGYGLSQNDYTDEDKKKVNTIPEEGFDSYINIKQLKEFFYITNTGQFVNLLNACRLGLFKVFESKILANNIVIAKSNIKTTPKFFTMFSTEIFSIGFVFKDSKNMCAEITFNTLDRKGLKLSFTHSMDVSGDKEVIKSIAKNFVESGEFPSVRVIFKEPIICTEIKIHDIFYNYSEEMTVLKSEMYYKEVNGNKN